MRSEDEIQKKGEPVTGKETPRPVVVEPEESSRFWPIPLVSAAMLEPLAAVGLVIVLVVFMLFQREDLRNRLIRFVGYRRLTFTTRALEEAGERISRYLLMQTIINSSFGIAVTVALYLIRCPLRYALGLFCRCVAIHSLCRTLAGRRCHAKRAQPGGVRKVGYGRSWLWGFSWLWNSAVVWFWSRCFTPRAPAFQGSGFWSLSHFGLGFGGRSVLFLPPR